jgi:DNA-directed RNA polymerase specialized sigma24 family protein
MWVSLIQRTHAFTIGGHCLERHPRASPPARGEGPVKDSKQPGLDSYSQKLIAVKARRLIGKHGFTRDDYDDLKQDLTLDLLIRLPRFDPRKAGWKTFVSRIIDRKVANLVRHQLRAKRDYRKTISVDWMLEPEPVSCCDDNISLDFSIAFARLSPDLKLLVQYLFTRSITDTARDLAVSRSTLYRTGIVHLQEAFNRLGLREYFGSAGRFDARRGK